MTEIYYCKNEDDMKRVAIHIFGNRLYGSIEEHLMEAGIYSCDYKSEDAECCMDCEHEECMLCKRVYNGDTNVYKHIELDGEVDYPCIVCVADTYERDERITIVPVAEAKDATKYGYGSW